MFEKELAKLKAERSGKKPQKKKKKKKPKETPKPEEIKKEVIEEKPKLEIKEVEQEIETKPPPTVETVQEEVIEEKPKLEIKEVEQEKEIEPINLTELEKKVEMPEMGIEFQEIKKEIIPEKKILEVENKNKQQFIEKEMVNMIEEKKEVPLIRFEGDASAPIIRYDLPSPSSYTGTVYIQTDIGKEYFGGDKIYKIDPNLTPEEKEKEKTELFKKIKQRFLKENHEELKNYLTTISREELERELDFYSLKEEEIGTELLQKVKQEAARKGLEGAKLKAAQAQTTASEKQNAADNLTNGFAVIENAWKAANVWIVAQRTAIGYIWVKAGVEAAYNKAKTSYVAAKKKLEITQKAAVDAATYAQDAEQEVIRAEQRITQLQGETASILSLMNLTGMGENQAKYTLFKYLMDIAWKVDSSFPSFAKTMGGNIKIRFSKLRDIAPKLVFVESHKLTSFPGDYGAGTTIKTFSLLPKEETEISIKTWKKSIATSKEASSILDSYTEEKADEFEKGIQNEASRTSKEENSSSFNVGASGGVSMGCASVSASVGYESGTSSAREDSVKNVMSATSKHAQSASAKRDVNIETSFESTEETGEEVTIMRKIENLNASRTLNFTFRQMNQQFHSILHLIDLRVGFYNGYPGSFRIYTLPELSRFVFKYMNIPNKSHKEIFDDIKNKILKEYTAVIDHQSNSSTFIEEVSNGNGGSYLRVIPPIEVNGKRTGKQDYVMRDEKKDSTGAISQPKDVRYLDGIILSNRTITMRTDGVIVEALLGQANALDDFALKARKEKIREDKVLNDLSEANVNKILAGIKIIESLIANKLYDKAITAYKDIFNIEEGIKSFAEMFNDSSLLIKNKNK